MILSRKEAETGSNYILRLEGYLLKAWRNKEPAEAETRIKEALKKARLKHKFNKKYGKG